MRKFIELAFGTKMASKCYSNLILNLKGRKFIQGILLLKEEELGLRENLLLSKMPSCYVENRKFP